MQRQGDTWLGWQHPPEKPHSGLARGDRRTEDATVLPPSSPGSVSLPPHTRLHHGAFSPPQQQGNGGFKCLVLRVEHKTRAFLKYGWPMHHPSWLAPLPAQLQLEKKGPASSAGCLLDHFTGQNSRAASHWQKHLVQLSFPKLEKLLAFESLCSLPRFPPSPGSHLFSPPATLAFWAFKRWSAILLTCPAHSCGNSRGHTNQYFFHA